MDHDSTFGMGSRRTAFSSLLIVCWLAGCVLPSEVLDQLNRRLDPKEAADGLFEEVSSHGVDVGKNSRLSMNPITDLYPREIADPRRPRFNVMYMNVHDTEIFDASAQRFGLSVGGRYGLVRVHPKDRTDIGLQFDVEGAIFAQFDLESSLDNIGWDGWYGAMFTYTQGTGLAFKLGTFHESSHIGDEYIENTGRQRIGYTRQEVAFGTSWSFANQWRTYAEAGWGYDLNSDPQEPWRLQFGLEWESDLVLWDGLAGWYLAADEGLTEERNWRGTTTIQAGIVVPFKSTARTYRFGVEYYNGRSPLGEFFQDDEQYIAIGIWIDL